MSKFKLFGAFEKVEELEDGTLKVSGIASSEAVDSDGEVIMADAMKEALPDYMKFGAVREMHTSWAAGTALKAEVAPDNRTYFEALVVDSEAVKKVQAGVYKGFSIGGRIMERAGNIIKRLQLVEVSLVDRPANPEAVFTFGKVDGAEEEPQEALAEEAKEEETTKVEEVEPVEKAGARFSRANREALTRVRAMLRECQDTMDKIGFGEEEEKPEEEAPPEEDEAGKAALAESLAKAQTLESDLAKALQARDEAASKAEALEKRVKELEAQPAPPKASVMAVSKAEDRPAGDKEEDLKKQADAIAALPPEEQAAALIKFINRTGGTSVSR
jgi:hypothetical protein